MNLARQRIAWSLVAIGLLTAGCEARSSVGAAQTAVAVAQTALPLSNSVVTTALQGLLAGANLDVKTSPEGAANDAVTEVTINATDAQGAFAQVDVRAHEAAATAALGLAAQYYPNASISLTVTDTSGTPLVSGSKAPGQPASVQ